MLIILSAFFLIVWLIFFKFNWLPWTRGWKITVYSIAVAIALVVVGALQYYTPVSAKAVVEAHVQQVYPLVTGTVESVRVDGDQPVSEGDVLFTIDPRPFQYQVDRWTAAEKLAAIELADAEELVKKQAIARVGLDQKQAAYDQAKAQLDIARYNLENTTVHAPADGYISLNALRPGQRVNSQTAALTFIDTSQLFIAAMMKQNGMASIEAGKTVSVTFDARPGDIFYTEVAGTLSGLIQGQVTVESSASPVEAVNAAQSLYPIRVAFPAEAPTQLRQPGNLATVTVFTDEGNPINILAKIIQWISAWTNYIL